MMDVLETLRSVYAHPTAYAARRHAAGQPVVGYFWDSVPTELIEAAGALPLRITGYPAPDPAVLDEKLYALLPKGFWQVRQSSLEFLNNSFGRLVDGSYAMLDALVIPNTRKPLLNLYGQLLAVRAEFPELRLPHLILLDRAATDMPSAHAFNRESVRLFRGDLETWLGHPIAEADIHAALDRRRANAALLRSILDWRRADRPGISGSDVLALIGSAMMMTTADHGALLRQLVVQGPSDRAPGPRLFVGGSPPDNDRLYRAIEATGATIVGEDHAWGERFVEFGEDDDADPMALFERRWDSPAATGFRLPVEAMTDEIVRRVKAARADAVILNVYRGDEMQIWDTPAQAAALEASGLPVLRLMEQPHIVTDPAALQSTIGGFLAQLKVAA